MASAKSIVHHVKHEVGDAVDNVWVERLVRLGFWTRGLLYVVIGVIAAEVALGTRSVPADTTGAFQEIDSQPFGQFLLLLMAVGLTGYALWGFIRAIWDPLGKGRGARGLVQRLGFLWSGFSYGVLVLPLSELMFGRGSGSGQTAQAQDMTARLLHAPWGVMIVAVGGLIVIAAGIGQFYYAFKQMFRNDLRLAKLSHEQRAAFERLAQWGYIARGVVFALMGLFLVEAALTFDPHKAQGLDGALLKLAEQPYGTVLLAIVALGLICFGIFSILSAKLARV